MNERSLTHTHVQKQQAPLRIDGEIQFKDSKVFCPMCEAWHENNTNCQRND